MVATCFVCLVLTSTTGFSLPSFIEPPEVSSSTLPNLLQQDKLVKADGQVHDKTSWWIYHGLHQGVYTPQHRKRFSAEWNFATWTDLDVNNLCIYGKEGCRPKQESGTVAGSASCGHKRTGWINKDSSLSVCADVNVHFLTATLREGLRQKVWNTCFTVGLYPVTCA